MFKVYLAGPISGLSYEDASQGWRRQIVPMLEYSDYSCKHLPVRCYSPMRCKDFLADKGKLFGAYEENPLATEGGIVTRDRNDVLQCDVMIACFLESQGYMSLGTAVEFGWADSHRKPIIMVAKPGDPHREHPMLKRMAGYIVETLEEAAALTQALLLPGI